MNAHSKQPLVAESLQERCYGRLKEQILRLDLRPGVHVSALEVAAQLGVSRTPVREALGQLEKEALVARDPAGGYVVRPLSVKEIDDVYRVREYLETEAALEAMPNLGEADLARLAGLLDAAERHTDDVSEFLIRTRAFHADILAATGNAVLQRALAPNSDQVRMIGAMLIQAYAMRVDEICAENREILRALGARDAAAAREAVRAHVGNGRRQIATLLAQDRALVLVGAPGAPE